MTQPPLTQPDPIDILTARVGELQMQGWRYELALAQAHAEAEMTPEQREKTQRMWAVQYLINGDDGIDIAPFC